MQTQTMPRIVPDDCGGCMSELREIHEALNEINGYVNSGRNDLAEVAIAEDKIGVLEEVH